MIQTLSDGSGTGREMAGTVLVVDDVPDAVELMTELLADRHEVRQAHDGREALSELDESIDVVLLDRKMPGLSGDEVTEEIRGRGLDIAIAIVSASEPDPDIVDVALDEYITKPVGRDELNSAVDRLLETLDYDDDRREYEAIQSKLAALERNNSNARLEASEGYRDLRQRFRELEDELGKPP